MQGIRKLSKFNMGCVVSVPELFHKETSSTNLGDYDKNNNEYKFIFDINNTKNRFDVAV